jgi:hypothetical protein
MKACSRTFAATLLLGVFATVAAAQETRKALPSYRQTASGFEGAVSGTGRKNVGYEDAMPADGTTATHSPRTETSARPVC